MTKTPEQIVDQMSLEEQVRLLAGRDFWSVSGNDRLGVGRLRVTDGPNGARGGGSLVGGVTAAAFPVGIALGATWNVELVEDIGSALADEVKSKGAHVSLAPTINLHRSVTNGRNFECYSEDPELTADLAVAYIRGLQAKGVAATPKHYAGNESEVERMTVDSRIDERTLRELYLRPFEAAVKEAGTWAIMSSYNRLNGTFASENEWLLDTVLRGDWGFDGVVMSDWFGSHTTVETVMAGLDLEMPGPTRDRGKKLVAAVEDGRVPATKVRERALNVLRLMDRTGALQDSGPHKERADDRPEHRALIRRAGAEGMVLLKNSGVLPLADTGTVAIIGPNAQEARIMGGGSAQLNPHYSVTPHEAMSARMGGNRLSFAAGCTNHRWEPLLHGDFTVDFFDNPDLAGTPVHSEKMDSLIAFWTLGFGGGTLDRNSFSARVTGTFTPDRSGLHRAGIHSAGYSRFLVDGAVVADAWTGWKRGRTFFEYGCDEVVGEVMLEAGRAHQICIEYSRVPIDDLGFSAWRAGLGRPMGAEEIAEAADRAAEADVAVVFVGRSGEWDTEGSDLDNITLPGQQDALVAAVAAANPNTVVVLQTGGPCEMPWVEDVAAVLQAWYPGQECGNAISDVLFGDAEPSGRLPQSFPRVWADNPAHSDDPMVYPGAEGAVEYREALLTGYRHYDATGIAPLFPFGHGLGYSTFSMDGMQVQPGDDGGCTVTVQVTNTGARRGQTVVQLYLRGGLAPVDQPVRVLRGFGKIALNPGASGEVTMTLTPRDFAWCDTEAGCWRVPEGTHGLEAGFSATDLRQSATVQMAAAVLPY